MSVTWVVLFRGVGGATQLPTAVLRDRLGAAGFGNVATYINSGNAIVSSDLNRAEVKARIAEVVERAFGFTKDIMLVSSAEWRRLIEANPFPISQHEGTTLHLFVFNGEPARDKIAALEARTRGRERIAVTSSFMYFYAPDGFGTSKLPPVVDRILGVTSTARNWNTVLKLGEMAEAG